jgi:hypothetical protein
MTTLFRQDVTCAICETVSTHVRVGSSNVLFGPDLDSRPGEMLRSTIEYWIQACPACGYCAPDLAKAPPDRKRLVESEAYRAQGGRPGGSSAATHYLRWAWIQDQEGAYADAGWAAMRAAWVCDDVGSAGRARDCRLQALTLFQKASQAGQRFASSPLMEAAVTADICRRVGRFEDALAAVERGEQILQQDAQTTHVGVIPDVLVFQRQLIQREDAQRYTVAEATSQQRRAETRRGNN